MKPKPLSALNHLTVPVAISWPIFLRGGVKVPADKKVGSCNHRGFITILWLGGSPSQKPHGRVFAQRVSVYPVGRPRSPPDGEPSCESASRGDSGVVGRPG